MHAARSVTVLIALTAASLLGACSEEPPAAAPAQAAPAAQAGHAPAGVVPGSHADWCAEHEVPESQCTRCDPSLAAAFKATGDWCDEHGLPESQCVTCDPSRTMTRPPEGAQ